MTKLRERLNEVVWNLCKVDVEDNWGDCCWEKTFTLNQRVDGEYMKVIFNGLRKDIELNIFKRYIPAESIFNLYDRLKSTFHAVNITSLESAYRLHEEVKEKYSDFLDQFYAAAADVFNENYVPQLSEISDDDLPF